MPTCVLSTSVLPERTGFRRTVSPLQKLLPHLLCFFLQVFLCSSLALLYFTFRRRVKHLLSNMTMHYTEINAIKHRRALGLPDQGKYFKGDILQVQWDIYMPLKLIQRLVVSKHLLKICSQMVVDRQPQQILS